LIRVNRCQGRELQRQSCVELGRAAANRVVGCLIDVNVVLDAQR